MVNSEPERKNIIQEVMNKIFRVKGIVDVMKISDREMKEIMQLEIGDESNAAIGNFNDGLRKVRMKHVILAIAKNSSFRKSALPTILMESGGEIVGEEISDSNKDAKGAVNIGELMIHRNRVKNVSQETRFIFPPLPFQELDMIEGIKNPVSASPGVSVDLFLKKKGGWDSSNPNLGTILLGFDLS